MRIWLSKCLRGGCSEVLTLSACKRVWVCVGVCTCWPFLSLSGSVRETLVVGKQSGWLLHSHRSFDWNRGSCCSSCLLAQDEWKPCRWTPKSKTQSSSEPPRNESEVHLKAQAPLYSFENHNHGWFCFIMFVFTKRFILISWSIS